MSLAASPARRPESNRRNSEQAVSARARLAASSLYDSEYVERDDQPEADIDGLDPIARTKSAASPRVRALRSKKAQLDFVT